MRTLALISFVALLAACGGSASGTHATSMDPNACAASECGPAPALAVESCPDGVSMSGLTGACVRNEIGDCVHEIRQCPPREARPCGGLAPGQNACDANEFCDYPLEATCGAADAMGQCRLPPEVCADDVAPVCGCNDQTYTNACQAAAAGVSVAANGACAPRVAAAGEPCGTRGALPCGEGLFCNFPSTANCGRADAPGTCAAVPASPCPTRVQRVCGCDGTTYDNACAANLAKSCTGGAGC